VYYEHSLPYLCGEEKKKTKGAFTKREKKKKRKRGGSTPNGCGERKQIKKKGIFLSGGFLTGRKGGGNREGSGPGSRRRRGKNKAAFSHITSGNRLPGGSGGGGLRIDTTHRPGQVEGKKEKKRW